MINYKFTIKDVDCIISKDELSYVIQTVYWSYLGEDEETLNVFEINSSSELGLPDPNIFVPFESINYDTVIKWLESSLDIESMKIAIEEKINEINNPTIIRLSIPK